MNIDSTIDYYKDVEVKDILSISYEIYNLLNTNGYRHSDVALFEAYYNDKTPNIFFEIPRVISGMEIDVLEYLLSGGRNETKILGICDAVIANIFNKLSVLCLDDLSQDEVSIYSYYTSVFERINNTISKYINKDST